MEKARRVAGRGLLRLGASSTEKPHIQDRPSRAEKDDPSGIAGGGMDPPRPAHLVSTPGTDAKRGGQQQKTGPLLSHSPN